YAYSNPFDQTSPIKNPARSSRQRAGYARISTKAGKTPQKAAVTAFQNRTLRAPFSDIPNASTAAPMYPPTYIGEQNRCFRCPNSSARRVPCRAEVCEFLVQVTGSLGFIVSEQAKNWIWARNEDPVHFFPCQSLDAGTSNHVVLGSCSRSDGMGLLAAKPLQREDECDEKGQNNELRNQKRWLRLRGSHRLQGRHFLEGLHDQDEDIQIEGNRGADHVDPTPG